MEKDNQCRRTEINELQSNLMHLQEVIFARLMVNHVINQIEITYKYGHQIAKQESFASESICN